MMLITNPFREYTLDFSVSEIKIAVHKLINAESHDYKLVNDDQILNQIRVHQKGRLLDLGFHIDFSFNAITDNQTNIRIEVSRNLGAINTAGELSLANNSLKSVTDKLSAFLSGNVDENTGKAKIPAQGCSVALLIITITLIMIIIYLSILVFYYAVYVTSISILSRIFMYITV